MLGADITVKPDAILFCCTQNSIRSPIAEGLAKVIFGSSVYIDSAGVRVCEPDGFMITVMNEIGIDMSHHNAKSFSQMSDNYFDLIVALSPQAQHHSIEFTRTMACDLLHWRVMDPSIFESPRAERLAQYRLVRDDLKARIMALHAQIGAL